MFPLIKTKRYVLLVVVACLFVCSRAFASDPFVWKETARLADGGWVRMVRLHNGLWLSVKTVGADPNTFFQIQISADNMHTWHSLGRLTDPGRNLDNGQLVQLPSGSILLSGRSVVDVHQPTTGCSYHLPVYISSDLGSSWKLLSQVATSVDPPGHAEGLPSIGLWEPFLFLLPEGKLACAYSDETKSRDPDPYSQFIGERTSSDGGATWGPEVVVASQTGGGSERPGMPVVCRIKNGKYGVIFEVVGEGKADVYFKTSANGVDWGQGIGSLVPGQHAGPYVVSLATGRLVATSCQNVYSYSDDYGATWRPCSTQPWPIGFMLSWPSIYQVDPKAVAAAGSEPEASVRFGSIVR
jgi:hypothetical protein